MKREIRARAVLGLLSVLFAAFPVSGFAPLPTRSVLSIGSRSPSSCTINKSLTESIEASFQPVDRPGPLSRVIRIANHVPAFLSLSYFGLVSMSSMMPGMALQPTLASVLTRSVGDTTNRMFADYFPTLVTPPGPVFLIWPLISLVQVVTIAASAFIGKQPALSQSNLSALSLANIAAAVWLIVASRTQPGQLQLASALVLPLVPLLSSYPLRNNCNTDPNSSTLSMVVFQLFSSFTTIASMLALTVELQHGGRLLKLHPELAATIFLSVYYLLVDFSKQSTVKRLVHAGAILGIAVQRMAQGRSQLVSPSFWLTLWVTGKALLSACDWND